MLSNTRRTPDNSAAPGTITDPISNGAPVSHEADGDPVQPSAQTAAPAETRSGRFRRKAHRTRLYGYAIAAVALVAYLIALAASNTARVHVDWVFGSSHVSLVWLVLVAAILGWLLGLATSARFHWRTRAPRQPGARS